VVTEPKPPEPTKRPVLPIKVSKEVIGFGELQPGQGAEATLVVFGGPGKVKVGSDMIKVEPTTFGPEETVLKVTVKGGLDGQVLWDALILESEAERVKVEIVARWSKPTATTEQETVAPVQEKAVEIAGREIVSSIQEPTVEVVEQKPVTPKVMPALSLRGFFSLYNVDESLRGRPNRGVIAGIIKNIFLLDPNLVLVISTGGAGLFDLNDGQALWEIDCPTEGGAISPDGSLLAFRVEEEILLVAIGEKTLLWSKRMEGHTDWVESVSFSPDGKFIASGSWDGMVCLWDVSSGKEIRRMEGHTGWVESVSFSPDGKFIASGSSDGMVRLWDVSIGREIMRMKGHAGSVRSVSFSPDGKFIASGSWDGMVCLWDVSSGKEIRRMEGHTGWVESVSFSPDGKFIASGSSDGMVRLWDVSIGREIMRMMIRFRK